MSRLSVALFAVAAGALGCAGAPDLYEDESSDPTLTGASEQRLSSAVWTAAAPMSAARKWHTATLLPSGQVLVLGGMDNQDSYLGSGELYNPSTDSWTAIKPMRIPRAQHTAVLLQDGQVLIAGGFGSEGYLTSVERYNPATNSWTRIASMNAYRAGHTATLLQDGRVLVIGGDIGYPTSMLAIPELYDPATNTWTALTTASAYCTFHTATLLDNGDVLRAGGTSFFSNPTNGTARYNPATSSWISSGLMSSGLGRTAHAATKLSNGEVLVAGGVGGTVPWSAVRYDPIADTWSAAASMSIGRSWLKLVLLPGTSGDVLAVGGAIWIGSPFTSSAATERYSPATDTWSSEPLMNTARNFFTATLLADGRVLATGGVDASNVIVASTEFYRMGE